MPMGLIFEQRQRACEVGSQQFSKALLSPRRLAWRPADGGTPILGQPRGWRLGAAACSSAAGANGLI